MSRMESYRPKESSEGTPSRQSRNSFRPGEVVNISAQGEVTIRSTEHETSADRREATPPKRPNIESAGQSALLQELSRQSAFAFPSMTQEVPDLGEPPRISRERTRTPSFIGGDEQKAR